MFKNNKRLIYVAAFIIPILVCLIVYKIIGVYPFGGKTLLFRDLDGQYVSYLAAFRNSIIGDGSIIYSFTKGIGGDMLGIISYYLLSPLNVIILIFPIDRITEAIELIILLKIGLCGLTLSIFLSTLNKKRSFKILLFSTSYALMSFNIVYQTNLMWLDGVYLLPIAILGINNIVEERKYKLYIIALTLTIITNFYIGFIICIFITIYFIYRLLISEIKIINKKYFLDRIKIFLLSSIVSVLLSMVVLVPTIMALNGGKAKFELFFNRLDTNFNFFDIVSKFYINGLINNDIFYSMPNIYCGSLVTILASLYFLNKKINKKEKIGSAIILFVILISFYINKLDLIWHGFNKPVGFPYRYSFVFSFFIILLAYKSFENLKCIKKRDIVISLGLVILASYYMLNKEFSYLSNKQVIITSIFAIFFILIIFMINIKGKKNIFNMFLAIAVVTELGLNAYSIMGRLNLKLRTDFSTYLENTNDAINYIKNEDKGFYRIEKTFANSKNDSMLMNYNSASHFSSMFKREIKDTLSRLGLDGCDIWYRYDTGLTPLSDSLLGIKYILTKDINTEEYNKFYEKIKEVNGIKIYENKNVLPIVGTMVNNDILNLDINNNYNTFDVQSKIINSMIDETRAYFIKPDNIKERNVNVVKKKVDDGFMYLKKDKAKDAYIQLRFKNTSDKYLYMYIPGLDHRGGGSLVVNGTKINSYFYYNYKVMPIGEFKIGEDIDIKIMLEKNNFFIKDKYLGYFDYSEFNKAFNELNKNKFDMKKISDTNIKGDIISDKNNNILYTTIPYSKEWKAYIDGEKVKTEKIINSFIGVKVPKGKHTIEFKYRSRGLEIGGSISIITIVVILFLKKKYPY